MLEINKIRTSFSRLDNWHDIYLYLIEIGKKLETLPEIFKIEKNLLHGCASNLWLIHEKKGDLFYFKADSESQIVKGLVSIVLAASSGKTALQIKKIDFQKILIDFNLKGKLTPSRNNGLFILISKIKTISIEN